MATTRGFKAKPIPQSVLDQLEADGYVPTEQHPDERPRIFRLKSNPHLRVEVTAHGLTGSTDVLIAYPGRGAAIHTADAACSIIHGLSERSADPVKKVPRFV